MKCPSCQSERLLSAYLETGLPCQRCKNCGGNWLYLDNYWFWKDSRTAEFKQSVDAAKTTLKESEHAIVCPKTDAFMVKYRISKGTNQQIDFSPQANAVWLDEGEWQLLIEIGLADRLLEILTEGWQKQLRLDKTHKYTEKPHYRLLDETTYQTLRDIHQWIHRRDDKSTILAFLNSPDALSGKQS